MNHLLSPASLPRNHRTISVRTQPIYRRNGVWHSFWITETVTAFVAYGIYRKALRNK